eukprot:843970_1
MKKKFNSNVFQKMTPETLKRICREKDLYTTPELNDVLYLHFQSFKSIENLEKYSSVKVLFIEGNCIERIENLECMNDLRFLYMQQNSLKKIENLQNLLQLRAINLSDNYIDSIENISHLPFLNDLKIKNNLLEDLDNLEDLKDCKALTSLDISSNRIKDAGIISILKQLPSLRCLYMKGNPVVNEIRFYRKTLVSALSELTYLEDRPVFENERRIIIAGLKGGRDGEQQERIKIKEEKMKKESWRAGALERYKARREAMLARQAREAEEKRSREEGEEKIRMEVEGEKSDLIDDDVLPKSRVSSDAIKCPEDGIVSDSKYQITKSETHEEHECTPSVAEDFVDPFTDKSNEMIPDKPQSLDWTKALDEQLYDFVQANLFDFKKVTVNLRKFAEAKKIANSILITEKACRERFAYLDSVPIEIGKKCHVWNES